MISSSIVFCGRGKQEISGRGWWTAPRQLETALSQQTNKPYLLRFSTSYFLLFQVDCKNQEEVSDLSWVISTASQKNITDGFCAFLQLRMSPSYLIEWKRVPLVTPDQTVIILPNLAQDYLDLEWHSTQESGLLLGQDMTSRESWRVHSSYLLVILRTFCLGFSSRDVEPAPPLISNHLHFSMGSLIARWILLFEYVLV